MKIFEEFSKEKSICAVPGLTYKSKWLYSKWYSVLRNVLKFVHFTTYYWAIKSTKVFWDKGKGRISACFRPLDTDMYEGREYNIKVVLIGMGYEVMESIQIGGCGIQKLMF
jgi:hypothetical protein